MNTFEKGNASEAAWLSYFVARGHVVLLPFGGGGRYDLVVDRGLGLERVQVKTARTGPNGTLLIPTCSITPDRKRRLQYTPEQIDLLAAYWPDEGRYFLIPAADLPRMEIRLRPLPTRNGQKKGIRHASAYEVT